MQIRNYTNSDYQAAFKRYLRSGTHIACALKALQPSSHYIWRTRGDDKVRSSHAANDGHVFAWDNPPATGHPGEAFGCRCTAEPYMPEVNESSSQEVTSVVDEGLYRWKWYDFVLHYYFGNGKALRLSDIGNLQSVIDTAQEHVFKRVERMMFKEARSKKSGSLSDVFINTYPFHSASWVHGSSTVKGSYHGYVSQIGNALHIDAEVKYGFSDVFTDPLDIRERNSGSSDMRAIEANTLIDSEAGGQFYAITGEWTTRITATIHVDSNKSGYK